MFRYSFMIEDEQADRLRALAERTGRSAAEHLRTMIDAMIPLHGSVLSGAMVLGVQIVTTSGNVWIGKGN